MGKISQALDKQNVKQCAYHKILVGLDDEDKSAINDAVSKGASGYIIANALREGGIQIADSTVGIHIRKNCVCYRNTK